MYTNFPSVVKSPQLAINRATSRRATSKAVQVSKNFLGGTISSVVGPIGYGMEYTFCFFESLFLHCHNDSSGLYMVVALIRVWR